MFQHGKTVPCSAMWSYVMAATRGDPRRRAGSVFTVQSSSCGPGPCRDGLHSDYANRYPKTPTSNLPDGFRSHLDRNAYLNVNNREFQRKGGEENFAFNKENTKDVLAEVRVQAPLSDKSRAATDPQLNGTDQVGAPKTFFYDCFEICLLTNWFQIRYLHFGTSCCLFISHGSNDFNLAPSRRNLSNFYRLELKLKENRIIIMYFIEII